MRTIIIGVYAGLGLLVTSCSAILNKQQEVENKSDKELQAQPSSHHSFYSGFGGEDFGGLDGFPGGQGGYGGFEDHHFGHHDHFHHHHDHDHRGHDKSFEKTLAIKGLLVPLVGAALLGVLVSNPILLQLGVVSGTTIGRKRRSTVEENRAALLAQTKLHDVHILERFMKQLPSAEAKAQEKKLMASLLTCSGLSQSKINHKPTEHCLERLVCELHGETAQRMPEETTVMNIVASEILENDFIPKLTKKQVAEAAERGEEGFDCRIYACAQMDGFVNIG